MKKSLVNIFEKGLRLISVSNIFVHEINLVRYSKNSSDDYRSTGPDAIDELSLYKTIKPGRLQSMRYRF
jgi:hypothetical protein